MSGRRATIGFFTVILGGMIWLFTGAAAADAASGSCVLDGKAYYHGAVSCQGGAAYRCEHGSWQPLGRSC